MAQIGLRTGPREFTIKFLNKNKEKVLKQAFSLKNMYNILFVKSYVDTRAFEVQRRSGYYQHDFVTWIRATGGCCCL